MPTNGATIEPNAPRRRHLAYCTCRQHMRNTGNDHMQQSVPLTPLFVHPPSGRAPWAKSVHQQSGAQLRHAFRNFTAVCCDMSFDSVPCKSCRANIRWVVSPKILCKLKNVVCVQSLHKQLIPVFVSQCPQTFSLWIIPNTTLASLYKRLGNVRHATQILATRLLTWRSHTGPSQPTTQPPRSVSPKDKSCIACMIVHPLVLFPSIVSPIGTIKCGAIPHLLETCTHTAAALRDVCRFSSTGPNISASALLLLCGTPSWRARRRYGRSCQHTCIHAVRSDRDPTSTRTRAAHQNCMSKPFSRLQVRDL